MNNKIVPIVIGVLVVGVAATAAFMQPKKTATRTPSPVPTMTQPTPSTTTPSTTTNGASSTTTPEPTTTQYTLAQVAEHAIDGNCWSAINGAVYDLGAWINKHPGGDRAILSICGKDGSAAFNGQHGGQSRPEQILTGFMIGTLVP